MSLDANCPDCGDDGYDRAEDGSVECPACGFTYSFTTEGRSRE